VALAAGCSRNQAGLSWIKSLRERIAQYEILAGE
jgi:hypothetical protein